MNKNFEFISLEYLDLEIKNPENYNLCKRFTSEKDKLVCCFRENYKHKIHSNTNTDNFEQLNTIIDLICNLSEKLKTSLSIRKLDKTNLEYLHKDKINENIIYLKGLLEDFIEKTKEENNSLNKLLKSIKGLETKQLENNKLLEEILYGKSRT